MFASAWCLCGVGFEGWFVEAMSVEFSRRVERCHVVCYIVPDSLVARDGNVP